VPDLELVSWLICTRCWFKPEALAPLEFNWHLGQPATVSIESGRTYVALHSTDCRALRARMEVSGES
jgi:hypothetical protein